MFSTTFSKFRSPFSRPSEDEKDPATKAKMGQKSTAYYDEKLKKWRFAGEEDQEEDLTVAPPPKAWDMLKKEEKTEEEAKPEEDKTKHRGVDSLCAPPQNYLFSSKPKSSKPIGESSFSASFGAFRPAPAEDKGEECKDREEASGESAPLRAPAASPSPAAAGSGFGAVLSKPTNPNAPRNPKAPRGLDAEQRRAEMEQRRAERKARAKPKAKAPAPNLSPFAPSAFVDPELLPGDEPSGGSTLQQDLPLAPAIEGTPEEKSEEVAHPVEAHADLPPIAEDSSAKASEPEQAQDVCPAAATQEQDARRHFKTCDATDSVPLSEELASLEAVEAPLVPGAPEVPEMVPAPEIVTTPDATPELAVEEPMPVADEPKRDAEEPGWGGVGAGDLVADFNDNAFKHSAPTVKEKESVEETLPIPEAPLESLAAELTAAAAPLEVASPAAEEEAEDAFAPPAPAAEPEEAQENVEAALQAEVQALKKQLQEERELGNEQNGAGAAKFPQEAAEEAQQRAEAQCRELQERLATSERLVEQEKETARQFNEQASARINLLRQQMDAHTPNSFAPAGPSTDSTSAARIAELEQQLAASSSSQERLHAKVECLEQQLQAQLVGSASFAADDVDYDLPDFVLSCGSSAVMQYVHKLAEENASLRRRVAEGSRSARPENRPPSNPADVQSMTPDQVGSFVAAISDVDSEQIGLVVRLLELHAGDLSLAAQICGALEILTFADDCNRKATAELGGVELILSVLERHENADVMLLRPAMGALWNMTFEDSAAERLSASEGVEKVLAAMRRHTEAGVQAEACAVLLNLAAKTESRFRIVKGGGVELIVQAIQQHPQDEEVLEHGCQVLYLLASHEDLRSTVAAQGATVASKAAAAGDAKVQKWGRWLQEVLAP